MVPLNTSVTSTGNYVLYDLDVAKINCAYMCEAQGGPCGGSVEVRAQPLQVPGSSPVTRPTTRALQLDQVSRDLMQAISSRVSGK